MKKIGLFFMGIGWLVFPFWVNLQLAANPEPVKVPDAHRFVIDHEVKRTPVKNQAKSGTCWSFATLSFLESELLRLGRGTFDLSEMFLVRRAYPKKAAAFVRVHGLWSFSQGGQSHDALDIIREEGIVPEEVYSGMNIGEKVHNHAEMAAVLQGILDAVIKNRGGRLTPRWMEAFDVVLDVYLGKIPSEFVFKSKRYTPQTFFSQVLQIDPNNYIELTSYSIYPFYRRCRLEIPDNWSQNGGYYNVPIDDLEQTIDYALTCGFSVVWDGDVSDTFFDSKKKGYAVVPADDGEELTKTEWLEKTGEPEKEKEIDQPMRDQNFADYRSEDDHLMHIVGLARDQKGTKFYYTKNSHGLNRKFDGYLYMSRSYVRLRTIAIMVHKDALPPVLKRKLGL